MRPELSRRTRSEEGKVGVGVRVRVGLCSRFGGQVRPGEEVGGVDRSCLGTIKMWVHQRLRLRRKEGVDEDGGWRWRGSVVVERTY